MGCLNMLKKINILIILVIFSLGLIYPILSKATDEIVSIKFEDINLYNAIVEKLNDIIENKNDSSYEIYLKQSNMQKVTKLDISQKNIANIKGLSGFTNVTKLYLHGNQITDISELNKMNNIEALDISQNKITDISIISNMVNLRFLFLGCDGIENKTGSRHSTNKITNLQPLKPLINMQTLEIDGLDINDISSLENMSKLNTLDLRSNNIEDITVLSKLKNIKSLSIERNKNIKDFQPISSLGNLTKLSLGNMEIKNIDFLSNLTNIETLNLSFNDITDINSLANMSNLKELSIGNNPNLEDISPLAKCKSLHKLYIPYDNIKNIDNLKELDKITISIAGNKIDNLNFIDETSIKFGIEYTFEYEASNSSGGYRLEEHPQSLEIETKTKEVELPQIFIQAQDKNSKIYSEQNLELVNCKLNENKNKIIIDDGIEKATIEVKRR